MLDHGLMPLIDAIDREELRAVIRDFYDRVFEDVMIGFMFRGADKERLIEREWELVARLLGARDVVYQGRSMRAAHARVPILGGHFERRMQILRDTLADHDVPEAVREKWLAHSLSLRRQVTADRGSECDHQRSAERLGSAAKTPGPTPAPARRILYRDPPPDADS